MAYNWNLVYLNHRILQIYELDLVIKKSLCYSSTVMHLGHYLISCMRS